ncbi:hypothetical protein NE237_011379 [Protea cynaroides]|uniref:Uncharacterized protein n=1 Tax=Protea cynaroides TaxID=273540 RepID=A0A9Q0GWY5_9MAGN|nr:hypothetical protein NE237_011379 [Protea cynaroides]
MVKVSPMTGSTEIVIDDAVVIQVETSDNGVMVGESKTWEDKDKTCLSLNAIGDQTTYVWCRGFEMIPKSEPVRRYEENDKMMELGEWVSGGFWGSRRMYAPRGGGEDEAKGEGARGSEADVDAKEEGNEDGGSVILRRVVVWEEEEVFNEIRAMEGCRFRDGSSAAKPIAAIDSFSFILLPSSVNLKKATKAASVRASGCVADVNSNRYLQRNELS